MSGQRLAWWAIALFAVVAAVGYRVSVSREPTVPRPTIAFVTGGSGPYWQSTVDGAQAAAGTLGAELQVLMPEKDENLEEQMSILARLDTTKLDGVALSPLDAEGQTHVINKLVRETKVVTFDSDAPYSDRHSHIGTSNFSAGRTCARLVHEALPGGGKVAVLMANLTKENLIDRRSGFHERISHYANDVESPDDDPRFTIVGYFEDSGDDQLCTQNIQEVLSQHPDLACFIGLNARHGPILLKTLQDLGKLGEVKLVTFDVADETLDGIEAGNIFATVAQDPYKFGHEAVNILCALCRGRDTDLPIVGKGSVYVSAEAIYQENLEEFRSRLRARQGSTEQQSSRAAE